MLAKRIIPCLDVREGRVVKGVHFENLRDAGDPVELARFYSEQGADEIVFLDITATHEERRTIVDVVERTAREVFVPLTVGGGIRTPDDFQELLRAGADKISINSAAIRNPDLINQAAERFGNQCVVVAIDGRKKEDGNYEVVINGGRIGTGIDPVKWAVECEQRGAGEILLTSMDHDGTKAGYPCELFARLSEVLTIPIIASGGAGSAEDIAAVLSEGRADAALAASIFHYGEMTVGELKSRLHDMNINVRI